MGRVQLGLHIVNQSDRLLAVFLHSKGEDHGPW